MGRRRSISTARAAASCATSSSTTRCTGSTNIHFDGLRLDAVHAIVDDSRPDIVTELAARRARARPARERHVHLVLENDRNEARRLARDAAGRPRLATAQWNDDLHHALHVLVTGERDGYYADYADASAVACSAAASPKASPIRASRRRFATARRAASRARICPPGAFVAFLQTHDQVGNRAFGERLVGAGRCAGAARRASPACCWRPRRRCCSWARSSAPPRPSCSSAISTAELAEAVTRGRRAEFARFERFRDRGDAAAIPDPNAPSTFAASRLDWDEAGDARPVANGSPSTGAACDLRREHVVPHLAGAHVRRTLRRSHRQTLLRVHWILGGGVTLHLGAHFGHGDLPHADRPAGQRRSTKAMPASRPAAAGAVLWRCVQPGGSRR